MHSVRRTGLALILGCALLVPLETLAAPEASIPSHPKVSESAARATALARVKGGIVQSTELESEAGKLVWSFDIERPGSKNATEILVDANTGAHCLKEGRNTGRTSQGSAGRPSLKVDSIERAKSISCR